MGLLPHQDLANLLGHRVFAKRLTLADAIAVIANGFAFIVDQTGACLWDLSMHAPAWK
jgi:hypothetical protein